VIGGRYLLGPRLGWGGMAEVYDAYDQRLARRVAVKMLRLDLTAHPSVRRRFEAEARAAARLTHPNVVGVYDTGEDDGRAYIVMERLPGETLADRFGAGPVDQLWLRQVAIDVLDALGAAHAAGIIHRDVKPSNILLTHDGRAKVADFGIAKTVEDAPVRTAVGLVIGTPAYLAPERIDGRIATPRSDLYAVGVVLYEGLTGRQPFEGTTPLAIAYLVRHEPPPDPRRLRPDADPSLVAAVARAIAYDPEARFASAGEMAAAIQLPRATATGVPVTAAPTAVFPVPMARPPRRRTWLPVVAGAAALGLGILALTLPNHDRAASTTTTTAVPAAAAHPTTPTTATPTTASPTTATTATTATTPATATAPTTAVPTDTTGAALQALADQLTLADGPRAPQLQTGLRQVASLPPGSQQRSQAATTLLARATSWNKRDLLSNAAFDQAVLVLSAAGATPPAPNGGGNGGNGNG
jgi:eukaryotic-like serine/threonine-protein kinase